MSQQDIGQVLPPGYEGPRGCGPMDLAPVVDLVDLVFNWTRTPPARPAFGGEFAHAYNALNLDNVRAIWHRGRPVSTVAISHTTVRTPRGSLRVAGIGGVATHPDHRQLGLSSALLEDAQRKMRADGAQLGFLSTGIPDFYRKLGWEYAGRQWRFLLDRASCAFLPEAADLEIDDRWLPDAPALCALYHAEPFGAERTVDWFTQLVQRRLPQVYVGRRQGRVVAYAGVRDALVWEYAGAPTDVAALLRAAYDAIDDPARSTTQRPPGQSTRRELTVTTPAGDSGLPALLQARGLPFTLAYLGMCKLLDAPALLSALQIDGVALTPCDAGWELRHAGGRLTLSERQLAKLVFGPERFPDVAPSVFPVPFFQWQLDRI